MVPWSGAGCPHAVDGDALMNRSPASLKQENAALKRELRRMELEREESLKVAQALPAERNIERLLKMILSSARRITNANAGSLYAVVDREDGRLAPCYPDGYDKHKLAFYEAQNDLITTPFTRFGLPIDDSTIAGYAARNGTVLNIPDAGRIPRRAPYRHTRDFDERWGYETISILAVPMKNHRGALFGVIELINKLRVKNVRDVKDLASVVCAFTSDDEARAAGLAGQAAISLENAILYSEIEALFESFVAAAVTAIESRDPTTAGHSQRVARLSVGLAEIVSRVTRGPYRSVAFSPEELRELEYAALLHDFGKVGVRENVLVKAKKLYDPQLQLIVSRFRLIKTELENELTAKSLDVLLSRSRDRYAKAFPAWKSEMQNTMKGIDESLRTVLLANEPSELPQAASGKLFEIASQKIRLKGRHVKLLEPEEVASLSILKGSLNSAERKEIESHVQHTFEFLSQIAWTRNFKNIPRIAYAHHEKLDGSGYPRGLQAPDIPAQSRIMTIADIYDALTAWDRPYKRAVSPPKALDILGAEAREGKIDRDLLSLFIESRVYEKTGIPRASRRESRQL
jgi:HD-GYP domain-containing protein (c-di-GMP phosphodiesterase class II)